MNRRTFLTALVAAPIAAKGVEPHHSVMRPDPLPLVFGKVYEDDHEPYKQWRVISVYPRADGLVNWVAERHGIAKSFIDMPYAAPELGQVVLLGEWP